jgi:hypothetical protein
MVNKVLLTITVLIVCLNVNAQNESTIDELIEQIVSTSLTASDEGEFVDMNQLRFELEQMARNPISANDKQMEVFTRLGILSMEQYSALQKHILEYGKLNELEELQMISGFDASTIRMLKPFISFDSFVKPTEFPGKTVFSESRKDLLIHYQRLIETPKGYSGVQRIYPGDLARIMVRWNMLFYKNWRMGLNLEKDAGETFGWNPKKRKIGFDHVSGFLQFKGKGILKNAIIGDFNAGFGQGLTFWKGLAFGKSANSVPIRKVAPGIRPHTGIDESLYLRGMGLTINKKRLTATGFISYRKLDANPLIDSLENPDVFTSIQTAGTHRTPSEIEHAKLLSEFLTGGNATYQLNKFKTGFTFVYQQLSADLQPRESLYRIHYFSGNKNWIGGAQFDYSFNNVSLFSEVSMSKNQKWAYLAGATLTPDPKFSFTIYNRWFQNGFQPIYSLAFGESSVNRNENGIYFGWEFSPFKKHKLTGYFDLFSFPWLKSNADAPGKGSEVLVQYIYKPSKKWEAIVRFRNKQLELNAPGEQNDLLAQNYNQFRVQFQFKPIENWVFRTRFETVWLKRIDTKQGYLLYLDVIYQPMEKPYSGSIRYAIFNTPDFATRIYAYERDVYYTYSVKPYFGNGRKIYLNLKWRFKRLFTFVFRIEQTLFPFQDSIGSGNDLIAQNHRSQFKVQIRIRW